MLKGLKLLVAAMLLVCGVASTDARAFGPDVRADEIGRIPVGSSEFHVDVARGPVSVYVYRPASATQNSPIWVVMHGVRREAYRHIAFDYYDVWARLADGTGLSIEGVYRLGLSDETAKANAMLTGLGRTRRVVMGDTLLDQFTSDEIEVIEVYSGSQVPIQITARDAQCGVVMIWTRAFAERLDSPGNGER